MTTLLPRATPSPVPLCERRGPRDVAGNVWVQTPELEDLRLLFDGVDWQVALEVPVQRRPSPGRHSA